jgi:hypothetical protein
MVKGLEGLEGGGEMGVDGQVACLTIRRDFHFNHLFVRRFQLYRKSGINKQTNKHSHFR